jgi:hypothetical protein
MSYPPPNPMFYGVPPGYPPYPQVRRPSTAPAYISAGLFLLCGGLSLLIALLSWDGSGSNPDSLAAVIGILFSEDVTGNVDFGIAVTMTVACSTLTFALAFLARLEFLRWLLGAVGAIVSLYYVYAVIYLIAHHAERVLTLVLVALLLWLAATIVILLPNTRRAMRGYQPHFPQSPPVPPLAPPVMQSPPVPPLPPPGGPPIPPPPPPGMYRW